MKSLSSRPSTFSSKAMLIRDSQKSPHATDDPTLPPTTVPPTTSPDAEPARAFEIPGSPTGSTQTAAAPPSASSMKSLSSRPSTFSSKAMLIRDSQKSPHVTDPPTLPLTTVPPTSSPDAEPARSFGTAGSPLGSTHTAADETLKRQPLKENWFRKREMARKRAFPQRTAWFRKHAKRNAVNNNNVF